MSEPRNAVAEGKRPNFLVLLVDEMRYPPIYESEAVRGFRRNCLRAQNRLRARGVEFHRHYIASVACSPSRTSLYTGQYPGSTKPPEPRKRRPTPTSFGSIPTVFRRSAAIFAPAGIARSGKENGTPPMRI